MKNSNLVRIPEEMKSEFSVSEDGKAFASRRATARLCGLKSNSPISSLLSNLADQKRLSDPLESFAGQDFTADQKLPDVLVSAIVSHYALKKREQAIKTLMAFAAIGIRTWIQNELSWQAPQQTAIVQDISDYEAFKLNMRMEGLASIVRSFVDGCSTGRLDQLEKGLKQEISDRQAETRQLRIDHHDLTQKYRQLANNYEHLLAMHQELQQNYEHLLKQKEYRQKLNQLVAKFGGDNEGYRKAIWNKLYGELIARTGFEVYAAAKLWNCSCLDAVETEGLMERLYFIASEFVVG